MSRAERVIVTGAASGIGHALAQRYAARGARLTLADRDGTRLEEVAAELRRGGAEAIAVPTDVTDLDAVRALVAAAADAFGGTDVLVNCAGIAVYARAEALRFEDWDRVLRVNLYGVVHTITAVLPEMLERRSGQIINIGSMQGLLSLPNAVPYCASKFAVVGLSRGLRAELRKQGIGVLVVNPGVVRTPIMRGAIAGRVRFFGRSIDVTERHADLLERSAFGLSAETVARRIVRAADAGEAEIELGVDAKAAALLARLFPRLSQRFAEMVA